MHLLPSATIQPNLELKTRPKQLLGFLPLVIALPDFYEQDQACIPLPQIHPLNDAPKPSGKFQIKKRTSN
jgi:hypothetical protein